ncbi:TetR/AcrR family transcriptional regulator [Oceanobacillus massiliensis]|uniref:TetR/AcrR family transcriptional regulator n=1 Tax=Oceanobacillus massiliensis TaxID=1465765 RepID=UPI0002892C09|nr:TetR/AcrR family transcriptional regulator [Oceanobacillus massiliensis]
MDGFERRRKQKSDTILNTALKMFMENGIKEVSVSEIAEKANVSQVTIYNYFKSKDNLARQVLIYYVDRIWSEYEELLGTNIAFPEKIEQIIFDKKEVASHIHEDFYTYLMKEYTSEGNYIERLYNEKALPTFIQLFEEGKRQGFVDPSISNEAILFFIQMFKEYLQRDALSKSILPLTEELTKLFFYGIMGKRD